MGDHVQSWKEPSLEIVFRLERDLIAELQFLYRKKAVNEILSEL